MGTKGILSPDSTVGILGGGQLGMMSGEAAHNLGYRVKTWAQDCNEPARATSDAMTIGPLGNSRLAKDFERNVDVVTFESENTLLSLAREMEYRGITLRPSSEALRISQDRSMEKQLFKKLGIPCAPTSIICFPSDLERHRGLSAPAILKTCRGGYDGKGQKAVRNYDELCAAWEKLDRVTCVLEMRIRFTYEMSIIVARDVQGRMEFFPAIQNEHKGGILHISHCPGHLITSGVEEKAREYAGNIARSLGLCGLLTVEFFVLGDQVFANEIAPRPHNSGHGTREACNVSQFEQHIRSITGHKLIKPQLRHAWTMHNLIGTTPEGFQHARMRPGAIVTDYGKTETRPGRKMGHVVYLRPLPSDT